LLQRSQVEVLVVFPPHHFLKMCWVGYLYTFQLFFNVQLSSYAIYFLNKKQNFFGLGFFGHKTPWLFLPCKISFHQLWHTPTFLEKFKCESKSGNNKIRRSGVRSLACNILGVEGHVGTLGWGLE
jgi:hypothetical protein